MTNTVVYTWGTPAASEVGPQPQTALRVWGDLVLEIVGNKQELVLDPPVTIRRDAVFALLRPDSPQAKRAPSDSQPVELTIDADRCAVARLDLADPLFTPDVWRRFHQWLADGYGYDPAHIEEEFLPTIAPMAQMKANAAPELLAYTDLRLLELLVEFFSPIAIDYLQSWQPLSRRTSDDERLEVVVPPDAIVRRGIPPA
jgi:hypothetical protein